MVKYTYDEWGNKVSVTGSMASTLGVQNPFRYRGYCYDEETGWYYLQSRYYDPVTGRFLNADEQINEGVLGTNLFAYCENNPVNMFDPSGEIAITTMIIIGSIVAGCLAAGHTAATSYKYTGEVDVESTILSGVSTFAFCYTMGMSAYAMYLSYCDYKGYTPVTNIGAQSSNIIYPPNNGFNATPRDSILQPGSTIQRSGGEQGRFVAPVNTPTPKLSLPPDKINDPIKNYTVVKPIQVQAGTAMPWFGQPGGGTQFLLPDSISNLIENGYLVIFPN